MQIVITTYLVLLTSPVAAEEQQRVYQTDAYGRIQHNRPSYSVGKDGRVVPTDAYGNKRYDMPQYKVEGDKVYETDAYGRVQQQKFEIKNEKGRSK
jgi:hypothetical protein